MTEYSEIRGNALDDYLAQHSGVTLPTSFAPCQGLVVVRNPASQSEGL
jgi:hypothetical protein